MKRFLLVVIVGVTVGFLTGVYVACQECYSLGSPARNFLACIKNLLDSPPGL